MAAIYALAFVAALLALSSLPACTYPEYAFVPDPSGDGGSRDTRLDESTSDVADSAPSAIDATDAIDAIDAGDCAILTGGDARTSIPFFGTKAQVVDGVGDEFCDIRATKLVASAGALMTPSPAPSGIDTVVWTRIAWSPVALHIHVRVDQASVFAPTATEDIWDGDSIELFVSGAATLTGAYPSTSDPGTFQIIAAPPGATAARARISGSVTYLDPAHFAGRLTATGYELELRIDWADLETTPASGKHIGFDIGVDVRQTSGSARKIQSFFGYNPVAGSTSCGATTAHPSCDDRTWCTPALD